MPMLFMRAIARFVMRCVLAAPMVVFASGRLHAAEPTDPSYYVKMPTWQESMRASRGALRKHQEKTAKPTGFKPFISSVLRGGMAAQRASVNVAELDKLWLIVTVGPDNYNWDQSIWAEPTLIAKDGAKTVLAALKPVSAKVGWGTLLRNKDQRNKPLQIGRKRFKHGFWAHAPSALCFALNKKYEQFEAWIGIGVAAGQHGSVRFKVLDKPERVGAMATLWKLLARDFTSAAARGEMKWEQEDRIWDQDWKAGALAALAQRYARAARRVRALAEQAKKLASAVEDPAGLQAVRELYYRSRRVAEGLARAGGLKFEPLRLAIRDLTNTYGEKYPKGRAYLVRLGALEKAAHDALDKAKTGELVEAERMARIVEELETLRHEALLANPLLDPSAGSGQASDRLLLVKRSVRNLGLPANWQSNSSLPRSGFDNEIALFSPVRPGGKLTTLYRPKGRSFVGDVDLHFDADRLLFSAIGSHGRWQVFEMGIDGTGLRQVTLGEEPDVDNYDACYLPDGRILFTSTAPFIGVPCVFGSDHVSVLFRMDSDGRNVRQLCFEQDHDWCPAVLNNGRVLYLRWEYTDTPHSQTRLLFHMNPDGTAQMEYYGSNSYWPNGVFYARPIPGHPTRVVGIVTGHHGVRRMGELVIFDPARGRHEASGAVQRIPGHGKRVEAIIRDGLVNASWPKFLHPYPLSERYFLVSCKPTPRSLWGIYLVDVFDNMLLLHEEPGYALLEPIPLRKTPKPPVIPDKVDPSRKDAIVYMEDVYQGDGLKGIPRGTVKKLRIFSYHFSYQGMGGLLGVVGMDGPWDIKRIVGTVPVEADGSALFRVPANTPVAVQPLDAEGKALQLMRSWMTAMPGEVLSCAGCHERQNTTPSNRTTTALSRPPSEIHPWYGPARGFSYPREVQPVIDKHCVRCHNGEPRPDGTKIADLRGTKKITDFRSVTPGTGGSRGGRFSVGYAELHRYVRRPGIESDYHLLTPMEFHADTTQLVQMLQKGHQNVALDPEAWDRLITWIDLNTPYHGTWTDAGHNPGRQRQRRRELARLYANLDDDPEADAQLKPAVLKAAPASSQVVPEHRTPDTEHPPRLAGWPFDAAEAKKRQGAAGPVTERTIDLRDGLKLALVLIPAGEFVMGDANGCPDERPLSRVRVDRPFWMGRCEVSNEQFACFDPRHDSRVETKNAYQFGIHGYPVNLPGQPVVRVSWEQAMAFCRWLSQETGEQFTLPTEGQWEYACRAGTATALFYGELDTDFSKFANAADAKLREFASNPYTVFQPLRNATKYDDWLPKDSRFNDGGLLSVDIGTYQPNAWGLRDMHGNMAEWTLSEYLPYPYREADGRNITGHGSRVTRRVVRGGSWRDRPKRCRSAFRLAYPSYQRVYNVTFRVVCEAGGKKVTSAQEDVRR